MKSFKFWKLWSAILMTTALGATHLMADEVQVYAVTMRGGETLYIPESNLGAFRGGLNSRSRNRDLVTRRLQDGRTVRLPEAVWETIDQNSQTYSAGVESGRFTSVGNGTNFGFTRLTVSPGSSGSGTAQVGRRDQITWDVPTTPTTTTTTTATLTNTETDGSILTPKTLVRPKERNEKKRQLP